VNSNDAQSKTVGPVPSPAPSDASRRPQRLRRLHHLWPDRNGNISYLLTLCIQDRAPVLATDETLDRLVAFLLDSPTRYNWFGRRFVLMPDHLHLITHQGANAITLGQWIKALKAVVGGVGPVPSRGQSQMAPSPAPSHPFTRTPRTWRWQTGFHDHKFRAPESESRKWEYICLNPVRAKLVQRPEDWPYAGEIFFERDGPKFIKGIPPLLDTRLLIEEPAVGHVPPRGASSRPQTPREGTRPTT
jgi:putative transposase